MLRAKCMKARSIRAGSNPAGSRGAVFWPVFWPVFQCSFFCFLVSWLLTKNRNLPLPPRLNGGDYNKDPLRPLIENIGLLKLIFP